jgi:spectinomycin phosphotransferase
LGPREHDLGLIGGTAGGGWSAARTQELFYRGYGDQEVNLAALAYYRCERAIQDIAAFCEQLFLSTEGGDDREQAYRWFTGAFLPGHEVELALRTAERAG